MGEKLFLWAFSFSATAALLAHVALAADPPPVNQGAGTYVPGTALNSPAVQGAANSPSYGAPRNIGTIPTPDTIPPPTDLQLKSQDQLFGQYRTAKGEVKLAKMFLDRYKQSVVRVIARDLAGNELSRSMGVGIGRNGEYIAVPLSIVLGNSQQWADRIEVTHSAGNKYNAQVALIDEEKNIVLLAPEANPAPIPFVRDTDERPQTSIFTISFVDAPDNKITASIQRGTLAAANQENGLLSVAGNEINDAQAGTAIINATGQLVGMLLPGGRGVLSSALQMLIVKARKAEPFEPSLIGMILGRGVLVDPKQKVAFPTIGAALEAIKKGEAPKADVSRYTPAKNRTVAPRDSDKVVIKVMPGTYKEAKPIALGSNVSLAGSGAASTTLLGALPGKPVLLLQDSKNVSVSGFRIVPAPLQEMKAPTVIVSKSSDVKMSGNVFEAKGGVSLWVHESVSVELGGNIFTRGRERALSCDRSSMIIEANGFIGDWPIGISADRACRAEISRNLFLDNKTSLTISGLAGRIRLQQNTFIRNAVGVKMYVASNFSMTDNLFTETPIGLISTGDVDPKSLGRNGVWQSKLQAKGKTLTLVDIVRSEPKFVAPASYDFRISPGKAQVGNASLGTGLDLGAFQRTDMLGRYTEPFAHALSAATGDPDLAEAWGLATKLK
ncbi:MAG: right-handed parallel beta-helix repeat-containing protein [Bacteriovoracia bacterium]